MIEAGMPGFESQQWFGLFGPAGLPPEIVSRLNTEASRVAASREMRERLAADGAEPGNFELRAFADFLRADAARWARVVKLSGATAE